MKKSIVIVDDFDNTLWILEFSLSSIDKEYELLKSKNGKEALAYFDGRKIDLLITDLNMPEMNGIELVRNVKGKDQYRKLPIIMLTTEKSPELKQEAQDLHITSWIQKPFQSDNFKKIIAKCLSLTE
jgi:two-component system chemotaxis response regulator CheY